MADLSQTAANVRARSATVLVIGQAGETITPGMPLYEAASKLYKSLNTTAANAAAKGVAVSYADLNDQVTYLKSGTLDPGATATQGETYVVTDTAGLIGIIGDRGSGDFVTVLGTGRSDGDIEVSIKASGIAKA